MSDVCIRRLGGKPSAKADGLLAVQLQAKHSLQSRCAGVTFVSRPKRSNATVVELLVGRCSNCFILRSY